jgi:hypothetical protein
MAAAAFAADQADAVFAAIKAKNDKEVTRLVQNLALARNFAQLDKVQAQNPELFDAKHFPGDYVSKIIFNYVENAAAGARTAQKATGKTNPYAKGNALWYVWDLDTALAAKAATKVAATQKTLQAQIDADTKLLSEALNAGRLDEGTALIVGLYLYSISPAGQTEKQAGDAERLNAQFASEAAGILEYLFKAGVPFPSTLPAALKFEAWKRELAAFDAFELITDPYKQNEYETKEEFTVRQAEDERLWQLLVHTEIAIPATLTLGSFNAQEGGFFPLSISLPDLAMLKTSDDAGETVDRFRVRDLAKADLRYYLDRKNAAFFKDKGFAAWTATATIALGSGAFRLKELAAKNGTDPVTEGLWGFRVSRLRGAAGETVVSIDNYIKGREYSFAGTKVVGAGARIPITADGSYSLLSDAKGPGELWKSDLTAAYIVYLVGDLGPAGGIVFYDSGEDSDDRYFLEAAPADQSAGIQWSNGNSSDIKTGTAVGSGKSNTDSIIAAQGSGNYAATLCKNLSIGGFSDWFLPSKDELNLMYTNLKKAGLGGFGGSWLWSSSQGSKYNAWYQVFSNGDQYNGYKIVDNSVRACRAF